jgi:hypothetical protein
LRWWVTSLRTARRLSGRRASFLHYCASLYNWRRDRTTQTTYAMDPLLEVEAPSPAATTEPPAPHGAQGPAYDPDLLALAEELEAAGEYEQAAPYRQQAELTNDGRGTPELQRSKARCAKLNGTKPPKRSPELWNYMREAEVARARAVSTAPQTVTTVTAASPRESHVQRRTGASSASSSADPGGDSDQPPSDERAGVGHRPAHRPPLFELVDWECASECVAITCIGWREPRSRMAGLSSFAREARTSLEFGESAQARRRRPSLASLAAWQPCST